jgi:hypothetical protein
MRNSPYLKLERVIAASDRGGILERWRWAIRMLADPKMVTPNGHLRHGKLAELIAEAKADGITLTEQEIQRRFKCGRRYRSEAEIRESAHGFKNWDELARAGFPAVQVTLDADMEPFDPRTPDEKRRDAAKAAARLAEEESGGQLTLFDYFPAERFDPLATLAELRKYAVECDERTARHADADRRRHAYLDRLFAAVGGNENATWEQAQAALDARGGAR